MHGQGYHTGNNFTASTPLHAALRGYCTPTPHYLPPVVKGRRVSVGRELPRCFAVRPACAAADSRINSTAILQASFVFHRRCRESTSCFAATSFREEQDVLEVLIPTLCRVFPSPLSSNSPRCHATPPPPCISAAVESIDLPVLAKSGVQFHKNVTRCDHRDHFRQRFHQFW